MMINNVDEWDTDTPSIVLLLLLLLLASSIYCVLMEQLVIGPYRTISHVFRRDLCSLYTIANLKISTKVSQTGPIEIGEGVGIRGQCSGQWQW